MSQIKILPHREKKEWQLIAKYSIGTKRNWRLTATPKPVINKGA
jgi:hypothetical protein